MNSRHYELTCSILEFVKIVNTANTNFSNLDATLKSLSKNRLIDDPNKWGDYEYRTHLGVVLNLFKQPALDKSTNDLFVKSVAAWLPLIDIFSKQVGVATKDLNNESDFAAIKNALQLLTNANRPEQEANLLVVYLSQFNNVFQFVDSWNKLDVTVRKAIYSHCQEKLNLKEMDVDTLFLFPFQHISRLQLHLGTMAKILAKYPKDVELTLLSKRFEETSKALQDKITEFNSQAPNANKSPIPQQNELDKSFVFI